VPGATVNGGNADGLEVHNLAGQRRFASTHDWTAPRDPWRL